MWSKNDGILSVGPSQPEIIGLLVRVGFPDTNVFKGERFYEDAIFEIRTHFKPTEKGEAFRLLRKIFKDFI